MRAKIIIIIAFVLMFVIGFCIGRNFRGSAIPFPIGLGDAEYELHACDGGVALPDIQLALPSSATNIYYYESSSGMQSHERFIRFDLDSTQIESAVDGTIAGNNKQHLAYVKQPLPRGPYPMPSGRELAWWNVSQISNGYYQEENGPGCLQIWVDKDKNRIYIIPQD